MNFTDAKKLKEQINDVIIDGNKTYKSTIVPENDIDFKNFITKYRNTKFTDESVISFSKNSKFNVCWLYTDGVNVIYKKLNK